MNSSSDVDMDDVEMLNSFTGTDSTLVDQSPSPSSRPKRSQFNQHVLNTRASSLYILDCMREKRLKLGDFLFAIIYGDPELRANAKAKSARRALNTSAHFPTILQCLLKSPRTKSKGRRARVSSKIVAKVTEESVITELSAELESLAHIAHMDSDDNLEFCDVNSDEDVVDKIFSQTAVLAPRLTRILSSISAPETGVKINCKIVNVILLQLLYRKNQRNNRFQKLVAMYLKAKGAPTKAINLLNDLGVCMSYRWATDATKFYSNLELASLANRIDGGLRHFVIHDNLRIQFRKETQRVNNQTHGDNGTSITVVEIRDEGVLTILANYAERYQAKQLEFHSLPSSPELDFADFLNFDNPAKHQLFASHLLIDILLESTPFANYKYRTDETLHTPPSLEQLPTGKENRTCYTMIATLPIEEASYEGNLLVLEKTLQILNNGKPLTVEQQKAVGSRGIPWEGDWLTFARLDTLKLMRKNDGTGFDRLDWVIPVWGWFHLEMLLANVILQTHRGSHASHGLARSISLLDIKGLPETNKKPYFHTVYMLLTTEFKARTLNLWLSVTGKDTFEEVVDLFNSPDGSAKMKELANKIIYDRASTNALRRLEKSGQGDDEVLRDGILLNRDLVIYFLLRAAIRRGDPAFMESLIPSLAWIFKGAGSNNYAKLLAEYMQWSRYEAPPNVSKAIRDTCWLVNPSGKPNAFYPGDQLQEHNNREIKNVHAPMGVNATWVLINALTPAVQFYTRVVTIMEKGFNLIHSSKHTLPDDKLDVRGLMKNLRDSKVFNYIGGRVRKSSKIKDIMSAGIHAVQNTNWLPKLFKTRRAYTTHSNTREDYDTDEESQDEDNNNGPMDIDEEEDDFYYNGEIEGEGDGDELEPCQLDEELEGDAEWHFDLTDGSLLYSPQTELSL